MEKDVEEHGYVPADFRHVGPEVAAPMYEHIS